MSSYDATDITSLKGLDGIKENPSMYIGSTSAAGLHHLVWELLDNSIDEVLAGECSEIKVEITIDNEIIVSDNGRGIPIAKLVTVFTTIHSGGKFGGKRKKAYHVSGGLHGVGLKAVNALSEYVEVTIKRDNKIYFLKFAFGKLEEDLKIIGNTNSTGTVIKFKPDKNIFKETTIFDFDKIRFRCEQLAFLNKRLHINIIDHRSSSIANKIYFFKNGIKEYIKTLKDNQTNLLFDEPIYAQKEKDEIIVEFALLYNSGFDTELLFFCNNINNIEGGTHEAGLRDALLREIKKYLIFIKRNNDDNEITINDIREGLTGIVSIKHLEPQYEGQTKAKLSSFEVRRVVSDIVGDVISHFLLENPKIAKIIIDKVILAKQARIDAKRAREITRKKTNFFNSTLCGKLANCSSKNPNERELFIVEGDSAGGTARQGRERKFQAVLSIRGKIINSERKKNIFNNKEIKDMITVIGTGIGKEFNIKNLKYHKIIFTTDADPDGGHIKALLIVFFFRYLRELIFASKVYLAVPPLYRFEVEDKIETKNGKFKTVKKVYYIKPSGYRERLHILREKYKNKKYELQQYKGLGEMNEDQLRETTIGIENRILKCISINDVIEAEKVISALMGDDVEARKRLILENADKFVE